MMFTNFWWKPHDWEKSDSWDMRENGTLGQRFFSKKFFFNFFFWFLIFFYYFIFFILGLAPHVHTPPQTFCFEYFLFTFFIIFFCSLSLKAWVHSMFACSLIKPRIHTQAAFIYWILIYRTRICWKRTSIH